MSKWCAHRCHALMCLRGRKKEFIPSHLNGALASMLQEPCACILCIDCMLLLSFTCVPPSFLPQIPTPSPSLCPCVSFAKESHQRLFFWFLLPLSCSVRSHPHTHISPTSFLITSLFTLLFDMTAAGSSYTISLVLSYLNKMNSFLLFESASRGCEQLRSEVHGHSYM